jgi:uncharacterized membrane protein
MESLAEVTLSLLAESGCTVLLYLYAFYLELLACTKYTDGKTSIQTDKLQTHSCLLFSSICSMYANLNIKALWPVVRNPTNHTKSSSRERWIQIGYYGLKQNGLIALQPNTAFDVL